MFSYVARARVGLLLFGDHDGAAELFDALRAGFPEAISACLMPNHVHLQLPHGDGGERLGAVMSGYARGHSYRTGAPPILWEPHPGPQRSADEKHARRLTRYILLNPCRARLVFDPLGWPWSTHRDACGLTSPSWGAVEREPMRFHRYVSADDTTGASGTPWPAIEDSTPTLDEVHAAVLAVTRLPKIALQHRSPARSLAIRTAWVCGLRNRDALMRAHRVSRTVLYRLVADLPDRHGHIADPALAACVSIVGDPRFFLPRLGRQLQPVRRIRS